jgi:hypothetical protein
MDDYGHPDQGQDEELISQKIVPFLEAMATRLASLEERQAASEEMICKIVNGFSSAATDHRKTKLRDRIGQEYGPKLEPVLPVYKKLVGDDRDPVQDIVEAVMKAREDEGYNPDGEGEFVQQIVEQILDRFGLDSLKRLIEPAVEQAVEGEGSVEIEVSTGGEMPEEDPVEKMKRALKSAPRIKI